MRIILGDDREVAERVWEIQRAAFGRQGGLVGDEAHPTLQHETVADLQQRSLIFLGVSDEGVLAGFVAYDRDGEAVEIDRLAVDPHHARRGLGTKLLREVFVRERNAERFVITTDSRNHPAVAFLTRLGFRVVGGAGPALGARLVRLERQAGSSAPVRGQRT